MKKGIHPDYHFIEVKLTDGTTYRTRSTYGAEGDRSRWTSTPRSTPPGPAARPSLMDTGGRVTKFKKKYEGLGF